MAAPDITKITAANITDAMALLRTHFTSVSTKWIIDSGVSNNGDNGFVIKPVAGSAQISLRRSGTTSWLALYDPTGSITAAGNTSSGPTGAHASQSSPEFTVSVSNLTTQEIQVLEWEDELHFLVRTTTSIYSAALVVGRALWQWWAGCPGNYCGNPIGNSGNAQVQSAGSQAQNWIAVASLTNNGSYITSSTLGGIYVTQPEMVGVVASYRRAGDLRRWSRNTPSQTPTYRYSNGTDEFNYANTGANSLVIEWKAGVTP
jgi:hypothetical protein